MSPLTLCRLPLMFKEDDRCHPRPGAPVSCPGAQLAFYPPLLCHRFVLLRIFGPFFEPHIFALFLGQLRAGSEKGAERGRHGDGGDIIGRREQKTRLYQVLPNHFHFHS